jgi:colanic acid/amylovoran biosynthesis glycosyltransferase
MKQAEDRITVLHYTSVWLPQTEIWLYHQLTYLPAHIESHVVCEATMNIDEFPFPDLHSLSDAPWLEYCWDKGLRKLRVRNHLGLLVRQSRKIKPHIVHSHFGNVGWANHNAVRKLGARHITTFYGLDVNHLPVVDPRWRIRYRDLVADVDRILCEGPHMAGCITALGCPEEKVRVHHLGVRLDDIPYCPRSWQAGSPLRVLIAGTFREKKGIPLALAALGAIRHELPIQVTIIGDATPEPRSQEEKRRIFSALDDHGLRSQSRLLGFRTHSELMQEAYKHHVFMSPSVTAEDGDTEGGAPVTIIEMAASGMPVVSTRHCDIPNVLPANTPLADEGDSAGLVKRLSWLIENSGKWESDLNQARDHIEQNFSAAVQGTRLAEIYRECL